MKFNYSNTCFELIMEHFQDRNKAFEWFYTPNSMMGGKKPIDYIKEDKSDKLLNLIKNSVVSNKG